MCLNSSTLENQRERVGGLTSFEQSGMQAFATQPKLQALPENVKAGATISAAAPANTGYLRQDLVEKKHMNVYT